MQTRVDTQRFALTSTIDADQTSHNLVSSSVYYVTLLNFTIH